MITFVPHACCLEGPPVRIIARIGREASEASIEALRGELVKYENGFPFVVPVIGFHDEPPVSLHCQRLGRTAAVATWFRKKEQTEAISLLLTGVDETEHEAAIKHFEGMMPPEHTKLFERIRASKTPAAIQIFITVAASRDISIRCGMACLEYAFGSLLP